MPTICSSCGRTSGRCQSCIRVDQLLTPERINKIARGLVNKPWGIGSRLPDAVAFARAISSEVVGILAEDQREMLDVLQRLMENHALNSMAGDEARRIVLKRSTPAASGIGESGGE